MCWKGASNCWSISSCPTATGLRYVDFLFSLQRLPQCCTCPGHHAAIAIVLSLREAIAIVLFPQGSHVWLLVGNWGTRWAQQCRGHPVVSCHPHHLAVCLSLRRTLLGCSTSRVPSVTPPTAMSSPFGHLGVSAGCIPTALSLSSCNPDRWLGPGRLRKRPCPLEPTPWPLTCCRYHMLHRGTGASCTGSWCLS